MIFISSKGTKINHEEFLSISFFYIGESLFRILWKDFLMYVLVPLRDILFFTRRGEGDCKFQVVNVEKH